MEIDAQSALLALTMVGSIGGGAMWVGKIGQQTQRNNRDIHELRETLERHAELSASTNKAVARVEGRLDAIYHLLNGKTPSK